MRRIDNEIKEDIDFINSRVSECSEDERLLVGDILDEVNEKLLRVKNTTEAIKMSVKNRVEF